MSGETDAEPSSWTPDLLNQQMDRLVKAERDWVASQFEVRDSNLNVIQERLRGIDRATVKFEESLMRVPTETDKQVGNLKELLLTRFDGVEQRFGEQADRTKEDKRVAQEALATALASAKELVGKQNEFSAAAIDKSETNTNKTIEKNRELADAGQAAISRQVDDMKDTLVGLRNEIIAITTAKNAVSDQKTDTRANRGDFYAAVAALAALIAIAALIYGALKP